MNGPWARRIIFLIIGVGGAVGLGARGASLPLILLNGSLVAIALIGMGVSLFAPSPPDVR